MFQSGVFLSSDSFALLSQGSKEEIIRAICNTSAAAIAPASARAFGGTGAYAMSAELAANFLEGCSNKTINTLKKIVDLGGVFYGGDLEAAMKAGRLSGVYTGITNRLRKLTGDPNAKLFAWTVDEDKNQWRGEMHPLTLSALKGALN